jgi:hypothetical protein
LRELAGDLLAVVAQSTLESRGARDSADLKRDVFSFDRDVPERKVLGVLSRDRNISRPISVRLQAEVDVEPELSPGNLDLPYPVPGDGRLFGGGLRCGCASRHRKRYHGEDDQ